MAPRPPKHALLNPELAKTHMPPEDKVLLWYTVKNPKYDNLGTIAAQFHIPPDKLIEFNFPGSVEHGHLVPWRCSPRRTPSPGRIQGALAL
jgi:hypothetical protein